MILLGRPNPRIFFRLTKMLPRPAYDTICIFPANLNKILKYNLPLLNRSFLSRIGRAGEWEVDWRLLVGLNRMGLRGCRVEGEAGQLGVLQHGWVHV